MGARSVLNLGTRLEVVLPLLTSTVTSALVVAQIVLTPTKFSTATTATPTTTSLADTHALLVPLFHPGAEDAVKVEFAILARIETFSTTIGATTVLQLPQLVPLAPIVLALVFDATPAKLEITSMTTPVLSAQPFLLVAETVATDHLALPATGVKMNNTSTRINAQPVALFPMDAPLVAIR